MNFTELFTEFAHDFVSKSKIEKVSVVCAGAGFNFASLLAIPGASRVISGIYLPYETNETKLFIEQNLGANEANQFAQKTVSAQSAQYLFHALKNRNKNIDTTNVAITAAIQAGRHRRGENSAFMTMEKESQIKTFKILLPKLDETVFLNRNGFTERKIAIQRQENDEYIVFSSLMLLNPGLSDYTATFERMIANGTITSL